MFAGSRLLLPVSTICVTLVPKPGRKEGHAVREPSLLSGIAVLRRSGSRKWRRPPVAARSGGAGAKEEQVGRKTRCRAPGSRRGGCRPRGSGGVAPFAWRPKPAAIRHVWGGAGNGGLAAGCPRPEEPPPSARRRMSIGPSTKEVQYHRMAPRVNRSAGWGPSGSVSGNRTEIFFFSSLPSLVSVTPHPSVSFLSPRLSLPPGTPRPPWRAPPRERGEGGVERSLVSTPRPARGDGVCDEWGGAESRGNGARPVEWMIMNDTCATHRSRVPRRSFGRNKRRSDDIGRRERTRPGFYFMFCVRQSSARGCRVSFVFVYFIKCV